MAKDILGGDEFFKINFKDKNDPFRRIFDSIINAYANNFKNVDMEPTRKLSTGILERFGKLAGVPLTYYDPVKGDTNKKLNMNSALRIIEKAGLIKNNPIKAGGGKLINSYDFTELMDGVINAVKGGDSPSEALQFAISDLRPTPVKKAPKRKMGTPSKKAQETRDIAVANKAIREAKEEGVIGPKTAERFSVPEALEPEPEPEKLTNKQALDRILNDPREAELVEKGKLRSGIRAKQTLADMPLKKAEGVAREVVKGDAGALEKMGQFLSKNKGKIIKSVAPAVIGGGIGLAAKGAEALDYAMSSKPTGRDPESMSTQQMEALLASVKGGDLTDEQRLATAEMPPEARQAEYLEKQLAERARPMEQGAAMQEDVQRSTRFQDEMKRLMERQQQKQGTAQ